MTLTDKEKLMIENIINNEYDPGLEATPWVFAVQEGSTTGNEFGEMEYKGVLGSLVKKELVQIQDHEGQGKHEDFYCFLTDTGKEVAKELFSTKYTWL